jgi:hypothetical protein
VKKKILIYLWIRYFKCFNDDAKEKNGIFSSLLILFILFMLFNDIQAYLIL